MHGLSFQFLVLSMSNQPSFNWLEVWKYWSLASQHTCRRLYGMHARSNNIVQLKISIHRLKNLHKSSRHADNEKKSKEKVSMNWMHYGSNMFFSQMNELRWEHGLSFHSPVWSMSIQSRVKASVVSFWRLGSRGYQFVKRALAFE